MAKFPAFIRFTVRPEHEQEVEALYDQAGFIPLRRESQEDGCITFVFENLSDEEVQRVLFVVPPSFSANQGFVAGEKFPFSSQK